MNSIYINALLADASYVDLNNVTISQIVATIRQLFTNNVELDELIKNLQELAGAFKVTKTGLSKATSGMKGLASGNKIEHIPKGLEAFKPFIQSENNVSWIDWQIKGLEFSGLSDSCPFCTNETSTKMEAIKMVSVEYDKNAIKNLIAILLIIKKLGDFFSPDALDRLKTITKLSNNLEKEHELYIVGILGQIDNLLSKLLKLKELSGFDFKDEINVESQLDAFKLGLEFFPDLNSEKTNVAVFAINKSIDDVSRQAGVLQGKIKCQRKEVEEIIKNHRSDINSFLSYAGFKYVVDIVGNEGRSQLKLRHVDCSNHLRRGNQHLSFGEKNAFAIVLFMYECLSKKPDLIILDDPISSFDKNKKFAILEMLFRRDKNKCLKSKTVLMLTHDVEPIIDTVKSLYEKFQNQTAACFLKITNGELSEIQITRNDIQTFSEICSNVINSDKSSLIKIIYLRRFYEIVDENGDAYQLLSNILHKRDKNCAYDFRLPKDINTEVRPLLSDDSFQNGCREVQTKLPAFNYDEAYISVTNNAELKTLYNSSNNGYEKLQLFRLLSVEVENSVIQKFINETYHIENEFICQLDPCKFDAIPDYVIEECNRLI